MKRPFIRSWLFLGLFWAFGMILTTLLIDQIWWSESFQWRKFLVNVAITIPMGLLFGLAMKPFLDQEEKKRKNKLAGEQHDKA